jgi:hypothetical protein
MEQTLRGENLIMHQACKETLYKLGWYQLKPPAVTTGGWTDKDWINHISACNGWLPNGGRKPHFMPAWLRKKGVRLVDPRFYDAGTILN